MVPSLAVQVGVFDAIEYICEMASNHGFSIRSLEDRTKVNKIRLKMEGEILGQVEHDDEGSALKSLQKIASTARANGKTKINSIKPDEYIELKRILNNLTLDMANSAKLKNTMDGSILSQTYGI